MANPKRNPFTKADIEQIQNEGLTTQQVLDQLDIFIRGVDPVKINRPCTVGDGIDVINDTQASVYSDLHDRETLKGRMLKFVPASGAATRMFKDWYGYLNQGRFDSPDEEAFFLKNLYRYPFYEDLSNTIVEKGNDIGRLIRDRNSLQILNYIITEEGMDYGRFPKALIKFHFYQSGSSRTPIEEHLVEAALHTKDASGICRLHFTVSDMQKDEIASYLENVKIIFEKIFDVHYHIGLSIQLPSTNTIAVDMENRPFRDESGKLTFRPGGHGALLVNLQALKGDIVFIKNIDNVAPDRLKTLAVLYKKIICGYLITLQKDIFRYVQLLSEGNIKTADISPIVEFCHKKLHLIFPHEFKNYIFKDQCDFLFKKLNRPIRVCGMVKNEGEPGGGPFWVEEEDSTQSLQIVEAFQVDQQDKSQIDLWKAGSHFNPVDLVCGLKDFRGQVFDLDRFVDRRTMCISEKSEKGRDLKALELPGLWNGSMSFWNTIFIETPIETFSPVKTVDDLLRSSHQPI